MQRPETGIKDGVGEVEPVHEFLFGPFRPKIIKKQDYLFRCPVASAEIFYWNDPKSRVSFTSQPDFSEIFCKGQTTLVHKGPFYILAPFPSGFNLHGLASKFSDRGSSV